MKISSQDFFPYINRRINNELLVKTMVASLCLGPVLKAQAENDALSLDRVIPNNFELAFPNERNIRPAQSDFLVKNFALMSNELGERWAVVTLTNLAAGRRTLTQQHLLAITASGKRIAPEHFSQTFDAKETVSLTIDFGESKFPLLTVESRTN